jgi:hypothetical protein
VSCATDADCQVTGQTCGAGTGACLDPRVHCATAAETSAEVCDGKDNDCDGIVDPKGACPEILIRRQSDAEMTWSPRLPTDKIDGIREYFGPCGTDEHGRPYVRTRVEVHAKSTHGTICELIGPYGGFVNSDPTDCRIRVHYKTVQMGSSVWCSGTWWAVPIGPYRR